MDPCLESHLSVFSHLYWPHGNVVETECKEREKTMGVRIFSDRSIQQESDSISRGGFWERGGKKDSGNSVVANNSFEAEATWGDLMASPGT